MLEYGRKKNEIFFWPAVSETTGTFISFKSIPVVSFVVILQALHLRISPHVNINGQIRKLSAFWISDVRQL